LEDCEAPKALCLDFARELVGELARRGYTAGVTQGMFRVDWPDEEAYEDWDKDDFKDEDEDKDAEEVMGQAMHFPLHYWVRITAKDGKPIGPVYADITADQFDDECDVSFDQVWVWTGETGRHRSQRHDFGGPIANLRYHHVVRMFARSAKGGPLSGFYGSKVNKVTIGLLESGGKKKGPRKPRKRPKRSRWDWSEFIGLKEKDPEERLQRQIRKYKRDKRGKFTK